jgi:hypothetical protein
MRLTLAAYIAVNVSRAGDWRARAGRMAERGGPRGQGLSLTRGACPTRFRRSLDLRRPMRLLAPIAAILAGAALVAGCGGDDSSGGALESSLAYVPPSTPFAVAIDTDVEGNRYEALDDILGRFPSGDNIGRMLQEEIERSAEGVSYEDDVRPLLGNPFVVSATDPASFVSDSEEEDFVGALQVADTDALDRLIEKMGAREDGEVAGATVYEDDGSVFAVEDDMVVLAASRELLDTSLERADGDDHLDVDTFERSLEGLPGEALARIYLDLQALIEQEPGGEEARQVAWVGALRTLGITATAADDAIDVEFNLRSEGGDLSNEDLPLAAGDEAPRVVRIPGQVGFGLRDPSQFVSFFEATFQTLDPQGFGDYETGKRAIAQRFDIDVDQDVFGQLTGDLSVSVAVDGAFGARAEVADPDAFADTVDRLAEALPQLGAGLGVTDVSRRGALYEARLADGGRFVFGVREDVFVAGSNPARALAMSSRQPETVSGASGSLVISADAEQVALQVLRQLAPDMGLGGIFGGGLFARPLDELSGSVATSTNGMRGSFSLTLD